MLFVFTTYVMYYFTGNIQEPSTICANKEGEKAELRKKVRAYFQACWCKYFKWKPKEIEISLYHNKITLY